MKKTILLVTFIILHFFSFSQIVKHIDLAEGTIKTTEPIESGKQIIIKIQNRSKLNQYEVIINRTAPEIPPLQSIATARIGLGAAPSDCDKLEGAYNNILSEGTESKLPQLRKEMSELIKKTSPACNFWSKAIALEQEMDISYTIQPLQRGETLEVTVKRITLPTQQWAASYSTGSKGTWKTSYGFAFIPNCFSKEEKFYLDASNKITKETELKNLDYAPAIFFNWFPAKHALSDFSLGVSGGLGINFNVEPVVFLGGSVTYNHNISINFGLAAHRLNYLKGRYKVGDIIAENNFDEEAGLHQKLFRVNPFLAVSFRFGDNPFKSGND